MLRTWAWRRRSGRCRSTTSMTLPNMAVRMAWSSVSLVAQANISSSDRGRRRTSKRPMARAGASAQRGDLGHAQYGVQAHALAQVFEQLVRVAVEQERRLAGGTHGGRLDLRLVDRAGGEAEVVVDLARDGELDRPRQLEAVAAGQLGGRGHAPDEVVLLQAEDPHAAAGHDRRGGEPVVPGADDDGVVVRHGVTVPEDRAVPPAGRGRSAVLPDPAGQAPDAGQRGPVEARHLVAVEATIRERRRSPRPGSRFFAPGMGTAPLAMIQLSATWLGGAAAVGVADAAQLGRRWRRPAPWGGRRRSACPAAGRRRSTCRSAGPGRWASRRGARPRGRHRRPAGPRSRGSGGAGRTRSGSSPGGGRAVRGRRPWPGSP